MTSTDSELLDAPRTAGTHLIDARLHLLDRQLIDADGEPIGIVDDLEIDDLATERGQGYAAPAVSAILTGQVLLTRIFGGKPPRPQLQPLPWHFVAKVATSIHLRPNAAPIIRPWIEHWLRDQIIERIPGGRRAAE